MGISRWLVAVAACAACGEVKNDNPDAPGAPQDAPTCTNNCLANGATCTAANQCTSNSCACSNATCSAKVCSATACACGFSRTGTTCDGLVAPGVDDGADSCGAISCDGTGACAAPLLWFKFDEPAGNGMVANSGTWPGGAMTTFAGQQGVAGKVGNAIRFAAAADGVSINDPSDNSLDGFTAWTVEGWINMAALPVDNYATLVKKNSAYMCRLVEGAGCVGCYSGQAVTFDSAGQHAANWTVPAMSAPTTNTWYHMACTYSGAGLSVYWNGSLMTTAPGGGALTNTTVPLGVGTGGGIETLAGMIDEVRMWTVARTPREICLDACGSFSNNVCAFDGVCDY